MGLIRIQIHLNRVNRFEWVQTLGTVARPTCQWCHVPYIKSPAERRPTRRHRDRVLPPSGSPPSPCASLADPPPLRLVHLAAHTEPLHLLCFPAAPSWAPVIVRPSHVTHTAPVPRGPNRPVGRASTVGSVGQNRRSVFLFFNFVYIFRN
jgi:hypothetical protein